MLPRSGDQGTTAGRRTRRGGHGRSGGGRGSWRPTTGRTAAEVLTYLPDELIATLASLDTAPRSLAEAAVQLLPFGSRAAMEEMNPPLAVAATDVGSEGFKPLTLTDFAFDVMAEAAASLEANPRKLRAVEDRADALIAELAASHGGKKCTES
jgi:hypothetical protein